MERAITRRTPVLIAIIVCAAVAAATVAVAGMGGAPEAGIGTGAAPSLTDPDGELVLDLTTSPSFTYTANAAPLTPAVQTISSRQCLVESSGAALVTTTAATGTFGNGMGMYGNGGKNGKGTPCANIESGQKVGWSFLTSAGTTAVPHPLAGLKASTATVDIEAKASAIAVATLKLGGQTVYTETLLTGASVNVSPKPVNFETCPSSPAGDSGPDSGPNDNCLWEIVTASDGIVFDSIEFTNGGVGYYSIEDGADWGAARQSHRTVIGFTGVGTLDCGDRIPILPASDTTAYATRLQNHDGSSCVPVLFRTANEQGSAFTFLKDLTTQKRSAFLFEVDWGSVPADGATKIRFDTDPAAQEIELPMCTPTPTSDVAGTTPLTLQHIDLDDPSSDVTVADRLADFENFLGWKTSPPAIDSSLDQVPGNAFFEYACLLHDGTTATPGADEELVYQWIYVTGDLRMSR